MAKSARRPAAGLTVHGVPGGKVSAHYSPSLPWCRTAKVVSSCECLSVEPPADDSAPTVFHLDLLKEPEARSFEPYLQLLDAAGAELARIDIAVQIGDCP